MTRPGLERTLQASMEPRSPGAPESDESDTSCSDEESLSPVWIGRAHSRYGSPMRGAAENASFRAVGKKPKPHAGGHPRHSSRDPYGSTGRGHVLPVEKKLKATLSEEFGSWLFQHGADFTEGVRAVKVIESTLSHAEFRDSTSEREELRRLIMAKERELRSHADPFQLKTLALFSQYLNGATDVSSLIDVLGQQVNGTDAGDRVQAGEQGWKKDVRDESDAEEPSVNMGNGPRAWNAKGDTGSTKKLSASALSTSGASGDVGGRGRKTSRDWFVDVIREIFPKLDETCMRRHASYNRRFLWPLDDVPTEGSLSSLVGFLKGSKQQVLRRFKNDRTEFMFKRLITALIDRGLLPQASWEECLPVGSRNGKRPKATTPVLSAHSDPDSDSDVEGGDTTLPPHLRGGATSLQLRVEPPAKKLWMLKLEPATMDWCVARIQDEGMSEQDARQAVMWVLSKVRPLLPEPSGVEVCWGRRDLIARCTDHYVTLNQLAKGRDGRKGIQALQILQEQYAMESSLKPDEQASRPFKSPASEPRAGAIGEPTKKRPLPASSGPSAKPSLPPPVRRQSSSLTSSDSETESERLQKKRPHAFSGEAVSGSSSSAAVATVGGPSGHSHEEGSPSLPADAVILAPKLVEELRDCLRDTRGGDATIKLILSKVEGTIACLWKYDKDQPLDTTDALRRFLLREAAAFRMLRVDRGYWIRFLLEVGLNGITGPLGLSAAADDDDSDDEDEAPPRSISPAVVSPGEGKEKGVKRGRPSKVRTPMGKEEGEGVEMFIKKLKAEKSEEKIVVVILQGLYNDDFKSQGISEADVGKVVEAIALSSKRDVPYVHMEELYKDIKKNMKEEAGKGCFKSLKDRGLKAALSVVKDTVRSHHIEAKISSGKLEEWGPVFAITAAMRGQMEAWARNKHTSVSELSRFAAKVLTNETLGLTGRREVLDWGRVHALVCDDSKTGAAVAAKAKQLKLSHDLKNLRAFLSEQA